LVPLRAFNAAPAIKPTPGLAGGVGAAQASNNKLVATAGRARKLTRAEDEIEVKNMKFSKYS
jgi:hypothetical protein